MSNGAAGAQAVPDLDGADAGAWLPVKEAAPRLGLTLDQLRRKLRRGEIGGRRVPTPTGHAWLVRVDGALSDAVRPPSDSTPAPPSAGGSPALARAQEMAVYSEQLLRPYVAKIETQAERLGRLEERTESLQAETERLRARVAELEAAPAASETTETPIAPQAEGPAARSWWQRLLGLS
jgi:hypothetical protein